MINNRNDRGSGAKVVLGTVMAIAFGMATPIALVLEMSFAFIALTLVLGGLLMVFLYCFAGRLPAMLYMCAQLTATSLLLNNTFMWMMLLAGTMPAVIMIRGIALKRSFYEQMRIGIIVCVIGLVAALAVARNAYGGNLIGRISEIMREEMKLMPKELLMPMTEAMNTILSANGAGPARFTIETAIDQIIELMEALYGQMLPAALVSGAIFTAVLSVLWGNWILARRGISGGSAFLRIEDLFLPSGITIGLTVLWIGSRILSGTDYAYGSTIHTVIYYIISSAFALQAAAACCRMAARRSWTEGKRDIVATVMILFGLVTRLFNTPMFIFGGASAIFGSHGVIRAFRNDNDAQDRE